MISRVDVEQARARIAGRVRRTPLLSVGAAFGGEAWLKLEYLQHTGSFKARGAFNRILSATEDGSLDPGVGIVVASGGNAGLAYAYAARALDIPATVFVPESAPAVKVAKLRSSGAHVELSGGEYAAAHEAAVQHSAVTGAVYCHAYDQLAMVAGAGTIGREVLEDLAGAVDTIVIAVGGGGLMAGVAAACEGVARVVGAEPVLAPTLNSALAHGGPVDVAVSGIAADSLGARRLGDIGYDVAVRAGVRSVLVSDDDMVAARRLLWDQYRIVVEHGAAAAMAALTTGAYAPSVGERFVILLCGANTDPASLS